MSALNRLIPSQPRPNLIPEALPLDKKAPPKEDTNSLPARPIDIPDELIPQFKQWLESRRQHVQQD
jgi:hypothetical protein